MPQTRPHARLSRSPTVLVDGEGHVGSDDLIAAYLTVLEGAVGIHSFHFQDAVVLLSLDDGGLVGLLLEHRRVLVHVVHLDVDGGPVEWEGEGRGRGVEVAGVELGEDQS